MATSKKAVSRSAKSSSTTRRVLLSQIKTDKEHDYCHRGGDALEPEKLTGLADSLVAEGQQTPLTVFDSGKRVGDVIIYTLIGGFRRYTALLKAIKENLDIARIHNDMEIDVVEVVCGETQAPEDFHRDLLVRSIAENEQRRNFTTAEKLEIVKQLKANQIPDPRAASALDISETQYRRFVSVTDREWLSTYVVDNCIGMSDAAELIQLATKKNRVAEFKEDFDLWVNERREIIEAERQRLLKVNKKLSGSAAHVKNQLNRKLVQHWLQCIESGCRCDNRVGLRFGIHVDAAKGTILVPSMQLKVNDLSSGDFETMIGELEDTVRQFVPLLRKCRMTEQVTDVSEEDIAEERQQIRERQLRRKKSEAAAKAGRPATDFDETAEPTAVAVDPEDEADESQDLTDDETDADVGDGSTSDEDEGEADAGSESTPNEEK